MKLEWLLGMFRQVRTPVVVGYAWLFNFTFLRSQNSGLESSTSRLVEDLEPLTQSLGGIGQQLLVSVVAYLVGSMAIHFITWPGYWLRPPIALGEWGLHVESQLRFHLISPLLVFAVMTVSAYGRNWLLLLLVLPPLIVQGLSFSNRFDRPGLRPGEAQTDLGVPVLGRIPYAIEAPALVTATSVDAPGSQEFRRLAAVALVPRNGVQIDSIAVTGILEGEGRTATAVNLALAISQSGRKVLLVAADRRNDALGRIFGLSSETGLNDYLRSRGDLDAARNALDAAPLRLGLTILPGGNGARNSLTNNSVDSLIAIARERNMVVVFDTPPALTFSEGLQLSAIVDSVYIVVVSAWARRSELTALRAQLLHVNANIAGAVFNTPSRFPKSVSAGSETGGSIAVPPPFFRQSDVRRDSK